MRARRARSILQTLAICFAIVIPHVAQCQSVCSATRLSRTEARKLMNFLPQAEDAKQIGGEISVIDWNPGTDYRTSIFYFFQVLSTKSTPTTPLGNGMIGYFGANKDTGQVVELNSNQPSVEGIALSKEQEKLRAKHCVSRQLVLKTSDIPLEK